VKQPVDSIDLSNGIRPGSAGLMKAIMPGVAQDGITINLVLPGRCRTARVTDRLAAVPVEVAQQIEAQLAAAIPIGRLGEPSELGHLLAFLASEQASYITGAVYQVDGGSIKSNL
jgi:3-oxoacyl-[acyl-carrier protein] reductase